MLPGGFVRHAGFKSWGERPGAAGTTCASGPGAKGKILCRALLGKFRIPGNERTLHRIGAALCWSCQKTALGTKEVNIEVRKWTLGKIREGRRELARLGIWFDRAGNLYVNTEAVGRKKNSIALPGLGLAKIDIPR